MSSTAGGDAYAVLSGFLGETPFEERIKHLPCTLGRNSNTDNHIHIGNSEAISRVHVTIDWDPEEACFQLSCKSKNGCLVDGKQVQSFILSYSITLFYL